MFKWIFDFVTKGFSTRGRKVEARLPVGLLIQELEYRRQKMQENPVGVDTISDQGYQGLIDNLRAYETEINNGPDYPQSNPIWGILETYAPYFTTIEYKMILELAKERIMAP